jgi:glycosyltransferase involved in cell wall biosynthesis
MISIVIPLYNKEQQIAKTLQTVLNQTYQDYEILIVNDGSTDRSAEIVSSFKDERIHLIHQKNAGVSAARNRGIAEARGEFVALLDADDEWKSDYLSTQMRLVEEYPGCDVFAVNYEFCDELGKVTPTTVRRLSFSGNDGVLTNYFEVASHSNPPIWTSAMMARKSAFLTVGGFPVGVTSGEDLLTWARLACRYKIAWTREVKAVYYTPTTGPVGKVPVDLQSTRDAVGMGLQQLTKDFPKSHVHVYVAYWYKMRSVINLNLGNRLAAIRCACKSIRFNPISYKPWAIIVLSVFPNRWRNKLFRK